MTLPMTVVSLQPSHGMAKPVPAGLYTKACRIPTVHGLEKLKRNRNGYRRPKYTYTCTPQCHQSRNPEPVRNGSDVSTSMTSSSEEEEDQVEVTFESKLEAALDDLNLKLVGKIGEGSVAEIYKAVGKGKVEGEQNGSWRAKEGQTVAIKVLQSNLREKSSARGLFKQEIRIWSNLSHPNIIELFHFNRRLPFAVCEFCEYGQLFDVLQDTEHSIDIPQIALDIARGIEHMHENNIVHRDIKSLNILLGMNEATGERAAKICDFGSAIKTTSIPSSNKETSSLLGMILNAITLKASLSALEIVGTPYWMAPEMLDPSLFEKESINLKESIKKLDSYSFAIVCWELLNRGSLPWHESITPTREQIKKAVVDENKRLPIADNLSAAVKDLISCSWHSDIEKRSTFQTIIDSLEVIEEWDTNGKIEESAKLAKPYLEVAGGRRVYLGDQRQTSFGRSPKCTLTLNQSNTISRQHGYIEYLEHKECQGYHVIDTSSNGMHVNNVRLVKDYPRLLCDGDLIKVTGETIGKICL